MNPSMQFCHTWW